MNRRLFFTPPSQILLAAAAGIALSAFFGTVGDASLSWVTLCRCLAASGANLFLIWSRALAVPLILASLILGAVGLEPMRALAKITRRTLAWMAVSSLLAVLAGAAAAFVLPPVRGEWNTLSAVFSRVLDPRLNQNVTLPWGWAALVLLGLGFAYYRNQIEEGPGRMLIRFCQAIMDTLTPLLNWTLRLAPVGVFLLVLMVPVLPQRVNGDMTPALFGSEYTILWYLLKSLIVGWFLFAAVLLPLLFWMLTRIPPWAYLPKLLPAALVAFGSGELEPALPLTMHCVRQELNVSNRVAGVVLSLGAAFQREGLALGLVAVSFCHWRMEPGTGDWRFLVGVLLAGWLLGLASRLVTYPSGSLITILSLSMGGLYKDIFVLLMLSRFVSMGGAAVSVLSHACAAGVIARGEGEFWVPGPPPTPEELQGMKNDLASADN